MSEWEEISKNRIMIKKDGYVVIKPKDYDKISVPLFCPLCKNKIKNSQDADYYRKYQVCFVCGTLYAEPNREKWQNGWRPDLSNKEV